MDKIIKIGSQMLALGLFLVLMAVNVNVGFNDAVSADKLNSLIEVQEAVANPCSSTLGCGSSEVYCGSIDVNDPDGPDYTIVCSGGESQEK